MSVDLPAVWRDYRNRRRLLVAAVAIAPLLAAAGASELATGGGHLSRSLLALSATSLVAASGWFAGFRCPYCRRPFHWTWLIANPLSHECLHCGFAKWRDPHAARSYGRRANDR
jgi:Zn ribbon nucleic-acid-binding protein